MTIQQNKQTNKILMDPINTTENSLKKNTKAVKLGLNSKSRFFRGIYMTSLKKGFFFCKNSVVIIRVYAYIYIFFFTNVRHYCNKSLILTHLILTTIQSRCYINPYF